MKAILDQRSAIAQKAAPVKILFLDIDGVLNHDAGDMTALGWAGWKSRIDPVRLNLLSAIVTLTGARVVLSSSWRFSWDHAEITKLLRDCGGTFDVVDITPREIKDRSAAINRWLIDQGLFTHRLGGAWALDDEPINSSRCEWIPTPDGLDSAITLHLILLLSDRSEEFKFVYDLACQVERIELTRSWLASIADRKAHEPASGEPDANG